jgi:LPS-assembly protein
MSPAVLPGRWFLLSITIILGAAGHPHLYAQDVTTQEPPRPVQATQALPTAPTPEGANGIVDLASIPHAVPLPPERPPDRAVLESDTQSRHGETYLLAGDAEIDYRDHILRADTMTYNSATGEVTVEGHVRLSGGQNDEYIQASHGTYNLRTQTGQFYDVSGSVEMRPGAAPLVNPNVTSGAPPASRGAGFFSPNPFLFDGRLVVKTGPESYILYNGSVTSCLLPHPDWQLFARKFTLQDGEARASNSTFKLLGIPILFLPVVTHPTDSTARQSGLLIPVVGYSSASQDTGSKGFTFGEQLYLALGRSADLTAGTIYYSLRGFSENATVRYRGPGDDFINAHFSALQDRGFTTSGGLYVNQGGEDLTTSFRYQFGPTVRAAGDVEYLSSYIYREAFTDNFNQAVSSDITSILYATRETNGFTLDGRLERYEGLKVVPIGTSPGEEVKIFHAPSIDFSGVDHRIARTPLLWSIGASAAGLKRVQPNFVSAGITERLDVRPEISLPLAFDGWHVVASVASEETLYSRSRKAPYSANAAPVELTSPVNRADVEVKVDVRPPVLERTFTIPPKLQWLLGSQMRHTIEPRITYRNVHGVDNFLSVLRFDETDLVSDTDEFQYGVTQHLYFRPRVKQATQKPGCPAASATLSGQPSPTASPDDNLPNAPDALNPVPHASNDANGIPSADTSVPDLPLRNHPRVATPCAPSGADALPAQKEWFSWLLAQKAFLDPTFGGAVINRRRNIFTSTLNLSGVAFLTEPRNISPLISRMRLRTSGHTDVEWDFDYDTGATKFTSQNVFLDTHVRSVFGGVSYARLNAPGRFYTEDIENNTLVGSATSNFNQMRFLLGYGTPSRLGLSVAGNAGLDLNLGSVQYATVQGSYNWNCCGFTVEYRKFELGSVRDENAYRFNFTLANIGSAGNLRRTEQIF